LTRLVFPAPEGALMMKRLPDGIVIFIYLPAIPITTSFPTPRHAESVTASSEQETLNKPSFL
jgi:hypothetical protein